MNLLLILVAFAAGLALGFALRPHVERRRRIRRAIAQLRARQGDALAARQPAPAAMPEVHMPRDYYAAGARERGSLAEGFGLRGAGSARDTGPAEEPDLAAAPMPRDYYERETPDDEGILSEGYGLKRRTPPGDAA